MRLNFIELSDDGKRLINFPETDDDVFYKAGDSYYSGYYDNDEDCQGFCSIDGETYHLCDEVVWWVYCKELEFKELLKDHEDKIRGLWFDYVIDPAKYIRG